MCIILGQIHKKIILTKFLKVIPCIQNQLKIVKQCQNVRLKSCFHLNQLLLFLNLKKNTEKP